MRACCTRTCRPCGAKACGPMRSRRSSAPDGGVRARSRRPTESGDEKVLAPFAKAFQPTGGLKVLSGNLGHAIIKTSAVKPERRVIEAPAMVFDSQQALNDAFKAGELDRDFIAVDPLPGAEGQRHAGTAQADDRARHPAGPRPQGGAGHRRPHVGRIRQGAGGDPRDAGGAGGRRDRPGSATATSSGSTPRPARWRCWCRRQNLRSAGPQRCRPIGQRIRLRARTVRRVSGRWPAGRIRARARSGTA